ncbi:helix-turn-helix domain-containing protein [Streptomyces viridosporus]|uniref:helix-turn-helix domain-containing protein n=1 Tax=Streptomyces viridosporus TaxID=67581 RepID=UPI0036FAD24F
MLRSALELFERLHAAPRVGRVRVELRAAGDVTTAAKATAENVRDRLTPQELQVVRPAAGGNSSREIAAQLILHRRTVEHHVYKACPKLGAGSRRELARRHQVAVLERHLNGQRVRMHASDRTFPAALLHGAPREVLRRMRLLVRPGTVLRRHRDLIVRRPAGPPARRPAPAQTRRPAAHRALDPRAGPAPGQGESPPGLP